MREKGKSVEAGENGNYNYYPEYGYSGSSDLPCKKHPSSASSVGICAYCLKERLIKLVCSDCGEQRLSSCSCSDFSSSSYRNSSSTVDVGSVGRISFLIENEKNQVQDTLLLSHPKLKKGERMPEGVGMFKRSNSCCVEVKRSSSSSSNGLWRIGRFFRKKKEKGCCDEKSEMWVSEYMDVSRSRSLCSFRGAGAGGHFNDTEEGSDFAYSSAKISDFSEAEPRKSGFNGESVSGVSLRSAFLPVKESDFSRMDESGFIDLKLDLSSSDPKTDFSVVRKSEFPPISVSDFGKLRGEIYVGDVRKGGGDGVFGNGGGSCRITVNERGIKKGSKGHHNKVWKWIFKHHPGWRSSASKKDINHILDP